MMCIALSTCKVLLQDWHWLVPALIPSNIQLDVVDSLTYLGSLTTAGGVGEITLKIVKIRVASSNP